MINIIESIDLMTSEKGCVLLVRETLQLEV